MIAPHLENLAQSLDGRATFYKVDTDEQNYLAGIE
jgi:thiol-disulfide isomerase/thioredoxin